jgi:transglutaminase-like putative cysteine protease
MLEAAAVVPQSRRRIEQPTAVERLRVKLEGLPSEGPELQGAGQSVRDGVFEVQDTTDLPPEAADPEAGQYLRPEPLIESDDPDVAAEAKKAVAGSEATSPAEKLVRYVNALLEKKPTVSLPSAREVLRTRVGDCNEHTALYVAMARSLGLPARVAVGLVYLHGAFYYHAWPEVYLAASPTRRHPSPAGPRRPGPPGRDPPPDRKGQDDDPGRALEAGHDAHAGGAAYPRPPARADRPSPA